VERIAAAVVALEDPEPHTGRHRGVVGKADPLSERESGPSASSWDSSTYRARRAPSTVL
jgi:hypothetical protein